MVIQVHGYTKSFPVTIAVKSYPDRSFTYSSDQVNLSPENKFQSSASLTVCILLIVSFYMQNVSL